MKIPHRVDAAAEQITAWVRRHRWLTASLGVFGGAPVLLIWLPAWAGLALGVFAGVCIGWGAGEDRRLLLAAENNAAQRQIGRLRAVISQLNARPAAEAATKAIHYITDPKEMPR